MFVDTLSNIATWDEPIVFADSAEILNYYIFLDEVLIDSVNTNQLSYTFLELTTGQSYNACIEAKYACGLSDPICYLWESQLLSINANQIIGLINVFPNPAKDYITITSASPITNIRITNYVGQEVFNNRINKSTIQKINTGNFKPGIYLIEVATDGKVLTKKIIIRY